MLLSVHVLFRPDRTPPPSPRSGNFIMSPLSDNDAASSLRTDGRVLTRNDFFFFFCAEKSNKPAEHAHKRRWYIMYTNTHVTNEVNVLTAFGVYSVFFIFFIAYTPYLIVTISLVPRLKWFSGNLARAQYATARVYAYAHIVRVIFYFISFHSFEINRANHNNNNTFWTRVDEKTEMFITLLNTLLLL